MSVRVMTMVLNVKLGSTARKVIALKLADCADDDGSNVFPSVARLSAECEVSERTVQYTLREFEGELGILEIVRRGGAGRQSPNEYRFNLQKLQDFPKSYEADLTNRPEKSKGAKSAPYKKRSRVQPAAVKGATDDVLGCNPCTRPIIDPSIPLGPKSKSLLKSDVKADPLAKARAALASVSTSPARPASTRPSVRARFTAHKGSREFEAWLAYYEAADRDDVVAELKLHGYINTTDRWPPGYEAAE